MKHPDSLSLDPTHTLNRSDISQYYHPGASTTLASRNKREVIATQLSSIYALELFAYTGSTGRRNESVALLLQKIAGETQYFRIGLALNLASVWFSDKGVETTTTIR